MTAIQFKKTVFLTLLLLNFSIIYAQTWRNFVDDDGVDTRELRVKGTAYENLFPEGIPIEAKIINNNDGYFIDLIYTWYGSNFDGPVYFSPELEIKIFVKIQNGKTYKLTKDLRYASLRISGDEQSFLDNAVTKGSPSCKLKRI